MSPPGALHLALGACIVGEAGRYFLHYARGVAPLNRIAAITLRLCDGRNTRADVIASLTLLPTGQRRAHEVSAFLDSARSLGWIFEAR